MTNDKLVLNISKINISPDSTRLKYSQDERGKQVDVTVIGRDGSAAYDLTGKKIIFSEIKDGGKIIIDDEMSHFIRTADNDKIGKFTYTFVDQTYQQSGEAHFEFATDIEHIDTTINFDISIVNSAQLKPDNTSYVSSLIALEAHYRATIANTETQTQNLITSLTDKIDQAISNGQRDVANELSDARAKLQDIQNRENGLIQNFNTRKADFDKLKSDWQAQSKSISDDYASKKAKIESEAQSQHDSIQAAADQQLKNSQSANDAEIAKIKSDAQTQHDQIEKAKNDAIAEITSQRDAAINRANADFKAEIDAFQKDYDVWKSATLADFTKQLADINTNISNDQSTLSDFDKKLDYTKQELANMAKQLDSLDFTKFVTGDQFKEAMAKKASGLKVMGLGGEYVMAVDTTTSNIDGTPAGNSGSGLVDSTVLAGVMQTISDAILGKNHYTKVEVDNLLKDVKDQLTPLIEQKADTTTLTDRANALAQQISDLQTENNNLKNVNAQLQQQNDNLQKQVTKLTPVHVSNVDDVANQNTFFVIVDD